MSNKFRYYQFKNVRENMVVYNHRYGCIQPIWLLDTIQ